MIQIKNTLISDEILTEDFVCNISKCKGICCVEGDSGAPVEESEKAIMDKILPIVIPYLTPEGVQAIEQQGSWTTDAQDHSPVTPLIRGKDCAYVIYGEDQTALCAIEQAFRDGKTDFKKPISCHLYPIRLRPLMSFTALNYHRWWVCSDACELGKELKVPIYKFLKEPLVRHFGKDWYRELELTAVEFLKQNRKP